MKSFIHWRHALVAPLVLVLLLSLALVSPVHAAKKPNRNNNNRAKIKRIRRQMAAQARILGKQITAVPAVQQALKRAADLVDMEKKNILRASPSWTGAWGRLNDRNNESEGTQKKLDQTVSVYNKYRIAGNKAARELNSNLKKKQVLVVQKHAAEQMVRQYGYYQRPGSKGSGSSQSPGSKGR